MSTIRVDSNLERELKKLLKESGIDINDKEFKAFLEYTEKKLPMGNTFEKLRVYLEENLSKAPGKNIRDKLINVLCNSSIFDKIDTIDMSVQKFVEEAAAAIVNAEESSSANNLPDKSVSKTQRIAKIKEFGRKLQASKFMEQKIDEKIIAKTIKEHTGGSESNNNPSNMNEIVLAVGDGATTLLIVSMLLLIYNHLSNNPTVSA